MTKRVPNLKNKGGLITYRDGRTDRCLGYLFHSPEHGTYDPALCRVGVTREEADIHNQRLSEALIQGAARAGRWAWEVRSTTPAQGLGRVQRGRRHCSTTSRCAEQDSFRQGHGFRAPPETATRSTSGGS